MNWKSKLTSRNGGQQSQALSFLLWCFSMLTVSSRNASQRLLRQYLQLWHIPLQRALLTLQPLKERRIMTMNEFEIKEAVKAFAYGFSAERVAEECDIPVEKARAIQQEHSAEIIERRKASYE